MKINLSNFISWQSCLFLLIILIFFIWLMYGGEENLEYIGLSPLKAGIDTKEQLENRKKDEDEDMTQLEVTQLDVSNLNEISELEGSNLSESNEFSYDKNTNFISSYDNNESLITFPNTSSFSESEEYNQIKISKNVVSLGSPRSLALGNNVCYNGGKLSKGEKICKEIMEEIYGLPFYCIRPDFLKNPETGRNLELDIYNDSLKIAVEYNGSQHYIFPNSFHKTYEEFIKQVRRDQFKLDVCDNNGVYLITVPHNIPVKYEAIKEYIVKHLPENYNKN